MVFKHSNWSQFMCRRHLDMKPAKLSYRWYDSDGIDDVWELRSSIHQGRTEAYMMSH